MFICLVLVLLIVLVIALMLEEPIDDDFWIYPQNQDEADIQKMIMEVEYWQRKTIADDWKAVGDDIAKPMGIKRKDSE